MEERDFFDEKVENKQHTMICPHCNQEGQFTLVWTVRRKRREMPRGGDELDRAKFAKAKSYMVRKDDLVACPNVKCRKRFEVSGIQSIAYMQDVPDGPIADREARLRAAFGRRSQG